MARSLSAEYNEDDVEEIDSDGGGGKGSQAYGEKDAFRW